MTITQEKCEQLTRRRWWVLMASCLINLCIGSLYTWSVFAAPMAEYLNGLSGGALTAGSLAVVFTVANSVGPITLITGGFFNDRMGPRWVIFCGGLLFGGGMLVCSAATGVSMLVVGFGLCCGLAMGLVYGCTVSNSIKFFPDHRGLIGGLATATYGIGSVVLPPIATSLIETLGVSAAFRIFGTVFLFVICGGSFLILRCPEGFSPAGWQPAVPGSNAAARDMNWRQMLADPIFYVMLFTLTCGAFSGLMVICETASMARELAGAAPAVAALAVSVLALFNGGGRVVAGWLSDRLGRIAMLRLVFGLYAMGLLLLGVSGRCGLWTFFCGVSLVGFCFGSFMGIFPGFATDRFGAKHNSVNYGILFIGFALAGFFGPLTMSALHRGTGSYLPAFGLGAALAGAGLGLTFLDQFFEKRR